MKTEAYDLMKGLDDTYWWYRARREIVADMVARYVPARGAIVDYGCGTGAITRDLQRLGFQITGADVSEEMLSHCGAAGLQTIDLRKERLPPRSTDCALACDVLEHVEDDGALLVRFREALKPGGYFIGTVPAFEFLWSGEDFVSNHYRRYTRRSLSASLRRAGYRIVCCSYFNALLFPAICAMIVGKRLFRPRAMYRSNVEPLPGWLNSFAYHIFALERPILGLLALPIGLSIVVVAADASQDSPVANTPPGSLGLKRDP
jgi:SAM-dependent methyltransferase